MRKIFVFILLWASGIMCAQNKEFSVSILVDDQLNKDEVMVSLHDHLENDLIKVKSGNILLYKWNVADHKVTFSPKNRVPEKPCETVIFLKSDGEFLIRPKLQIKRDSTGKITDISIPLESRVRYLAKHVDFATSRVLYNTIIEIQPPTKKNIQISIAEFEKFIGTNASEMAKKSPSEFAKKEDAFVESYKQKIIGEYRDNFNLKSNSKYFAQNVLEPTQKTYAVLPQPGLKEKKVKKIEFRGGKNDNLIYKDNYKVIMKKMLGNYHYYDDLATMYIDVIGDSVSTASTLLFGDKDLAKELVAGTPLLMVKENNHLEINRLNMAAGTPGVSVAIKKNGVFGLENIEKIFYESPVFSLVERNAPELSYFAKLAKNENFIDYSLEDIQGRQLGYELLLSPSQKHWNVTEIKTTKNIYSFEKKSIFGATLIDEISQGELQRILSAYKPDVYKVELVSVLEEKKDKIEKIAIYHPAGLDRGMEYIVYTFAKEDVDGEEVLRKTKLARGKIGKSYSPCMSELNIKDGEKEFFKAYHNKEKFIIEISEKSK